jgi:hypothetical protein
MREAHILLSGWNEGGVQITSLYSWGPPEIASRVEIDVIGQYLKPYLDTIWNEDLFIRKKP